MNYQRFLSLLLFVVFAIVQPYAQSSAPSLNAEETVNKVTGGMSFSLPLLNVKDIGSHSYPINLEYSAGIQTNLSASMVGLGFDIQPGVIKRIPVMIADEDTSAVFIKPVLTGWKKFNPGRSNIPHLLILHKYPVPLPL